jgi:hypothetical protein
MYTCAQCAVTTDDPMGWLRLLLQPALYVADAPETPFVASGEPAAVDFHAVECRDAWLLAHDLPTGAA